MYTSGREKCCNNNRLFEWDQASNLKNFARNGFYAYSTMPNIDNTRK